MLTTVASLLQLAVLCLSVHAKAPTGPWDAFNFAPYSKTVRPTYVKEVHGSVKNANGLLSNDGHATLSGSESWITVDFGKEASAFASREHLELHVSAGWRLGVHGHQSFLVISRLSSIVH